MLWAMDVELSPPLMGTRHQPMKLVGPATLQIESTGLRVRASHGALPMASYALFAGTLLVGGIGIAIAVTFKGSTDLVTGIATLAILGLIAAALSLKRTPKGDVQTHHFPWENIKEIKWDSGLLIVVKKMKPKGALHIDVPPNSELERDLGKAHREFLRAEQRRNK